MPTFKARARTLDMLGQQQIAGIPTAISELFKNAHDAYAERVEVDFYRAERLLLLRDDGTGMTVDDFERRWLTLGTESKVGERGLTPPPPDPDKAPRPLLGEKGIGRLAIAVIGPQVLVLTRAKRHDLVAAFIHWGLFASPGVDLDQIEIPIRIFPGGTLPDRTAVAEMVGAVRENVRRLGPLLDAARAKRLDAELADFAFDPRRLDGALGGPSLRGDGHGTHFYIAPTSDMLAADIDGSPDDDTAPPLIKSLIGFTNTMIPDHSPPRIRTSFRDHRTRETFRDLIAEGEFFTPKEFASADHHIAGTFDRYGQFLGAVSVYGETFADHVVPWTLARGHETECGPFAITLGYVQGAARESTLPSEEYQRIIRKLNQIGGLYIYRDDVRILPYGDTDFDWLDIERNRTKGAGYYFFSYRRMFGLIELHQGSNDALSEKAGREGFRTNRAYRQFRDILRNFFVQIAAEFFRATGTQVETFHRRQAELDRLERARREREKQVAAKRGTFGRGLEAVFARLESDAPRRAVADTLESVARALDAATADDPGRAAASLIDAEAAARRELADLRRQYRVAKPRGVGLTRALRRDWETYQREEERLEDEVFAPAVAELEKLVEEAARRTRADIDHRHRIERALREMIDTARGATGTESRAMRAALEEVRERATRLARESAARVSETANGALSDFARLDLAALDEVGAAGERRALEARIVTAAERERELLAGVREQLRDIDWTESGDDARIGASEMTESLEEEVLALRERQEADLELAQLGMAFAVVGHEFNETVATIRSALKRLRVWASANENLGQVYQELSTGFEHLDGYLALFTPLQRRLNRTPVPITGDDIADFLRRLFGTRLQQDGVTLETTPAFQATRITAYPSTFYPVFVNLTDNALFWLRDAPMPRLIRLDADGEALIVSDTGPGVRERDRKAIFEFGFTRKPGGRGLGLAIARDALVKAGYSLSLEPEAAGRGATFRIAPTTKVTTDTEGT
jgi:signal transduction histidine kinase